MQYSVVIKMTTDNPKYSDIVEMLDSKFMELRKKELKDKNIELYGGEFITTVWRRTYTYRGIAYDLAMVRYLSTSGEIGMNKYGKWVVLEYPEETVHIADVVNATHKYDEFLYRDTLHFYNADQTLEEMFYDMADRGQKDIDWFLDVFNDGDGGD